MEEKKVKNDPKFIIGELITGRQLRNIQDVYNLADYMNINDININSGTEYFNNLGVKINPYKNTLLLWLIFNCVPDSVLNLLKLGPLFSPPLNINKGGEYLYRNTPLQVAILKGRNRECKSVSDIKTMGPVIDVMIKYPKINLLLKNNLDMDALYLAMIKFDNQTILSIIRKTNTISEGHIDFWIKHVTHYKEDGQQYIDFVNYLLSKIILPIEEVTMNSGIHFPIISKYIEKTSIIESCDLENDIFIDFYEHYKLLKLLKEKLNPEKLNESFINLSRENPSVKVKLIYNIFKKLQAT